MFPRLSNGGEYLFQAHDDSEMSQWVSAINNATGAEGGAAAGEAKSQTLPASGAEAKKEKKGFFTMKTSKK